MENLLKITSNTQRTHAMHVPIVVNFIQTKRQHVGILGAWEIVSSRVIEVAPLPVLGGA